MAKKSANDWKAEGADLKKLLDAAKKKDHNCAVFICSEGVAIEADPRLSADNLAKKAKKRDGATPNGVTGVLKVTGSNMQITCLSEPPGSLEPKLKQYLAKVGLKMKPVLIPPQPEEKPVKQAAPVKEPEEEEDDDADVDIGKIIDKARKKTLNVAWLIADKGLVLKAHARLPIDKLRQQAKSEGGGQRGACGQMNVSGKTVLLTCEEAPPKSFPRLAKVWLGEQGIVVQVKVALPDGAQMTDEDEEGEDAAKPGAKPGAESEPAEAAAKKDGPEPTKEQLTEDLKHVSEIFKLSFDGMEPAQSDELKKALKNIAGAIQGGDLVGAQNMMNKLGLITGVTPSSPIAPVAMPSPSSKKKDGTADPADLKKRKKELIDAFAEIKPDLQKKMDGAGDEDVKVLKDLIADFGAQTKSDKLDEAETTLEAIRKALEGLADAEEDLSPEARGQRRLDLDDLESSVDALIAQLGGMEALGRHDDI